jgi:hypothetical protein
MSEIAVTTLKRVFALAHHVWKFFPTFSTISTPWLLSYHNKDFISSPLIALPLFGA